MAIPLRASTFSTSEVRQCSLIRRGSGAHVSLLPSWRLLPIGWAALLAWWATCSPALLLKRMARRSKRRRPQPCVLQVRKSSESCRGRCTSTTKLRTVILKLPPELGFGLIRAAGREDDIMQWHWAWISVGWECALTLVGHAADEGLG